MEPRTDPPGVRLTPHLMFGLLIILVGVVFTLDNLNIAHAEDYLRYWPAGLIAIGLAKLWQDRREPGSSIGGVIFTLVGTLAALRYPRICRGQPDRFLAAPPGFHRDRDRLAGDPGTTPAVGREHQRYDQRGRDSERGEPRQQLHFVQGRRADRLHGGLRNRPAQRGRSTARRPSTCSPCGAASRSASRRTGR